MVENANQMEKMSGYGSASLRKIYDLNDFMYWPNIAFQMAMYKPFKSSGDREENKISKILNLWFYFGAFNLIYQSIGLAIYLLSLRVHSEDPFYKISFRNISETGGILGLTMVASCEMLTMIIHRKSMGSLLQKFHNIFPDDRQQKQFYNYCKDNAIEENNLDMKLNGSYNSKQKYGVEKHAKTSYKLMKYTFIFFLFAISVYNLMPIVYFILEYVELGKLPAYRCQSNTWYPWQDSYKSYSLTLTILSYFCQFQSSYTGLAFIMAGEFMLCFFITQMQLHFDFLSNSIQILDAGNGEQSCYELKQLIIYHVKLLRYSEEINKLFNVSFMVNFCTSSIAICLMGFSVLSSISHVFKYSVGVMTFLIFTLFICYNGSEFTTSNEKIVPAIFHSNWYYGNKNYRRMINILMMRAEKPLVLHAYKFTTISMSAYTEILKFSYQLFTFFRAMG